MKILRTSLIILLILSAAGFLAFRAFFKMSLPDYEGIETLSGLTAPVEVRTDAYGIAHIHAQNEADLFFAQGYITARERLFQMDMTRRAARGELAALFGEVALERDRFARTIGFHRHARRSYPALLPETKAALRAFAAGVNTCIGRTEHLPREYFFLKADPRPWEPEDAVAIGLLMSYSMTRSKKIDLVLHEIRETAGEAILKEIKPAYPAFAPTLTKTRRNPGSSLALPPRRFADVSQVTPAPGDFPFPMDLAASNWMVFGKERTATGRPMFAGSPDLAPTLPGLFYIVHLSGGGFNAMGGTLPGIPGLSGIGFNGRIAFSAVNGRVDELDYFIEKTNPDNPGQYLTENGYEDFRVVVEEIEVKTPSGWRTEKLPVRITRHGPIVSGVVSGAPENCAMQWSALDIINRDIDGQIMMLKAQNGVQLRQALRFIRGISLNIGYADADGNIGWQFTGAPPLRKKGDGSLPAPGWTGEYDWQGFVPFSDLPHDANPEAGYTASFNNDPGNAGHHLSHYFLFERAIRFEQIMASRPPGPVTFADLKSMQMDRVSVVAKRWVPLIIAAAETAPDLKPAVSQLRNWDCRIDRDSSAATLFNDFYYRLMANTLKDDVGEKIWEDDLRREYLYYVPDLVLTRIMDEPRHRLFDDGATVHIREERDDIIRRSLADAVAHLRGKWGDDPDDWRWGHVHRMRFVHPLGRRLFFFNLDPVPTDGSHHTIHSGFWDTADPFRMTSGGVIRMMVDFSDPEKSTIISPPGQSGHYLSPHYDDLVAIWAAGDQVPMHFFSGRKLSRRLDLVGQ